MRRLNVIVNCAGVVLVILAAAAWFYAAKQSRDANEALQTYIDDERVAIAAARVEKRAAQLKSDWKTAMNDVAAQPAVNIGIADSREELETALQRLQTFEAAIQRFIQAYNAAGESWERELEVQGISAARREVEMAAWHAKEDPQGQQLVNESCAAYLDLVAHLQGMLKLAIQEWGNWSVDRENVAVMIPDSEMHAKYHALFEKAQTAQALIDAKHQAVTKLLEEPVVAP